ncbi:MAG: TetR/AcrR family transcriptional regulator [Solirubrobacteraceae bacterium]|nr:TetR/AcrR family transcriptional regulator [Solirubrobacteraceae bacterium]
MTATPHLPGPIAARPLRADARRNREKVLEAARAEFAAEGQGAQMPDIARRAGVGVGTVYRHFPTKEALVEALAADHFSRLADDAERAVAHQGDDPWEDFMTLVERCGSRCADDRGLAAAISGSREILADAAEQETRLRAATTILLERARDAGQVRADATVNDVAMIMCSLAYIADMENEGRGDFTWRRYMQVAFDGMRAR